MESGVEILEVEKTQDDLIFEKDGVKYHQLFAIDYAVELIGSGLQLKGRAFSDPKTYRINDT